MLSLPNNCRSGKMSVFPSNWKTVRASPSVTWRISYWFYDDNLNKKRKIVIKGMNHLSTALAKKQAVEMLMADEIDLIKNQGYNRITETYSIHVENDFSEHTPFCEALDFAFTKVEAEPATIIDLKSCLNYLKKAAVKLSYDRAPVGEVKRRHLMQLLEKCGEIKKNSVIVIGKKGQTRAGVWTANTYNQYRSNLSMLYKRLVKMELVDSNIVEGIDKQKSVIKIRETLSKEERKTINELIFKKDYYFWRFLHIFFHSGSRTTEILRLKHEDVDLSGQRFKVLVKKGGGYREEWRVIKDVALSLWDEIIQNSKKGQYLFGEGLVPRLSDKPIRREQITKRWKRHIKVPLGITADFYSLKHSNIDETAELLSINDASKMAGHTTSVITMAHYAVGEKERQHNRLKTVANKF